VKLIRPDAWRPHVDASRPRQRWVAVRDLPFVDATIGKGTELDEVLYEELGAVDRDALNRQVKHASDAVRFVVVLFDDAPRFLEVGTDVRLWAPPTALRPGAIRRNRSSRDAPG
jgi:hypothetical protein